MHGRLTVAGCVDDRGSEARAIGAEVREPPGVDTGSMPQPPWPSSTDPSILGTEPARENERC
ncbi:hypothetical protein MFORT_12081 [Mycolicibacterium fortuitum subsp. fortuitum DSM 46621 = ATCC 6841 = JCM 6387]|uniref:Uncharacterized protein n=1 Tax=Mycolicibacterium fortuitum subsp. fortuitum DSM 46621 = ATCC 6841 = JCM 6387 TaxID=1214102 RepID=K0VGK6_MYCFO|nr:hypothetical protein ATO49_24765 [Mycolicibacterium fortuitum subsp. fortuitum DSM 46621 = ATCC 6841 = JCM 6387]EJZ13983.1 hypothetical protein MFORT_12081 [Mycolicibacterium fortuitum subsp. fortuitum DSM 46621 = ATCC 6841 = JCM 6387]OBJ92607.1 hypothetical protein A5638_28900 [Mycolicibacterium fortuitum]